MRQALGGLVATAIAGGNLGKCYWAQTRGASMMLRHASFLKQYYVFQGCVNFPFAYVSFTAPKSK